VASGVDAGGCGEYAWCEQPETKTAAATIDNTDARGKLNSDLRAKGTNRSIARRAPCIFFTPRPASIFLPHFPVL